MKSRSTDLTTLLINTASLLILCTLLTGTTVAAESDHKEIMLTIASSNNFPPINILDDDELSGLRRDLSDAVLRALEFKTERIHSEISSEFLDWLVSGEAGLLRDTARRSREKIALMFHF